MWLMAMRPRFARESEARAEDIVPSVPVGRTEADNQEDTPENAGPRSRSGLSAPKSCSLLPFG